MNKQLNKTHEYRIKLQPVIQRSEPSVNLSSPSQVAKFLEDKITHLDRECFVTICLDIKNNVLGWEMTSVGTVNTSAVSFREIFKLACLLNACGIIVAHNHPSGTMNISKNDKELTKALIAAGEIFQICVLDHVCVSHTGFCSVLEVMSKKKKRKK